MWDREVETMDKKEQNKAVVRQFIDCVNNDADRCLDQAVAEDYVHHSFRGTFNGRDAFRAFMKELKTGFPDLRLTVVEQVLEGDVVVNRMTMSGTHKGPFAGVAPTNRRVTWTSLGMVHLKDGKIKEQWLEANATSLLSQIGAIKLS